MIARAIHQWQKRTSRRQDRAGCAAEVAGRRWKASSDRRLLAGGSRGSGFFQIIQARPRAGICCAHRQVCQKSKVQERQTASAHHRSNDRVASSVEIQRELDEARQPVRFTEVAGADHSMRGHETKIAHIVAEFISESLN